MHRRQGPNSDWSCRILLLQQGLLTGQIWGIPLARIEQRAPRNDMDPVGGGSRFYPEVVADIGSLPPCMKDSALRVFPVKRFRTSGGIFLG